MYDELPVPKEKVENFAILENVTLSVVHVTERFLPFCPLYDTFRLVVLCQEKVQIKCNQFSFFCNC